VKDWLTDKERAELRSAETWTRVHALAMMAGLVALIVAAVRVVLA